MDDDRIWAFEKSLWTADPQHYADSIDEACLMVLPSPPYVFTGRQSVDAVASTPRWDRVAFSGQQVARPQEGLIVIAYRAEAGRGEERYTAHCTSTYRHLPDAHGARTEERWQVVQHQQTPPLVRSD